MSPPEGGTAGALAGWATAVVVTGAGLRLPLTVAGRVVVTLRLVVPLRFFVVPRFAGAGVRRRLGATATAAICSGRVVVAVVTACPACGIGEATAGSTVLVTDEAEPATSAGIVVVVPIAAGTGSRGAEAVVIAVPAATSVAIAGGAVGVKALAWPTVTAIALLPRALTGRVTGFFFVVFTRFRGLFLWRIAATGSAGAATVNC